MYASHARGGLMVLLALCVTSAAVKAAPATPPEPAVAETFRPASLAADLAAATPPPPAAVGRAPARDPNVATLPLPPGFYVGLMGLASAAVARRRYLKRR